MPHRNLKQEGDPKMIQALGLAVAPVQTPSLWQRARDGLVWLFTEAGTELPEFGLWFCSTWYGIAALYDPAGLDKLVAFAALRGYISTEALGLAALVPALAGTLAAACWVLQWDRAQAGFRTAAIVTSVWFYLGVGLAIWSVVPNAPGLGFYAWPVAVAIATRLRVKSKKP